MQRLTYCFCAASLLAAAACGSDDNVDKSDITDEEYDDVATSLASTTRPSNAGGSGEIGAMVDATVLARGGVLPGFTLGGTAWVGDKLGMSYRYELDCEDSAGNDLPSCGPAFLMIDLERSGAWSITGLNSNLATFDGSGHMEYDSRIERQNGDVATYDLEYDADYSAIVVARDSSWPSSGEINYSLSIDRVSSTGSGDVERHFDLDAKIEFIADGHATLTIDGSRTYDLDMQTGAVVRF